MHANLFNNNVSLSYVKEYRTWKLQMRFQNYILMHEMISSDNIYITREYKKKSIRN